MCPLFCVHYPVLKSSMEIGPGNEAMFVCNIIYSCKPWCCYKCLWLSSIVQLRLSGHTGWVSRLLSHKQQLQDLNWDAWHSTLKLTPIILREFKQICPLLITSSILSKVLTIPKLLFFQAQSKSGIPYLRALYLPQQYLPSNNIITYKNSLTVWVIISSFCCCLWVSL